MPELFNAIEQYFTPSSQTFWKWSEGDRLIEWTGGRTIVFRAELRILLETLAPQGLPPLENILLTIAATRDPDDSGIEDLDKALSFFGQYTMAYSLTDAVRLVMEPLDEVTRLPREIRRSTPGRQAILALMSENGPRRATPEFARGCVRWLDQGFAVARDAVGVVKPTNVWMSELRGLHAGLGAVNEAAVRIRMATGLESLILPAPVELLPPEPEPEPVRLTPRELLLELEQDEDQAGLARLTRRLLSLVSLPRPISATDDQPLGGVSDITNRGPFDRLLLSELAQDSDVLMTRVALNEAMYIRREVPPAFPPRERLVLVDAGVRMWGLPRLYATAAALALAAMQADQAPVRLFRAEGKRLAPIELTTRDVFLEHLGSLQPTIHPGDALPAFQAAADGQPAEFVLVTGEDVLLDPDFQLCLAESGLPAMYLIGVTREGELRLLHRTRQGTRVVREARLDLPQIMSGPAPSRTPLRDSAIDPRLPAICRMRPFPLYLTHQLDWENCGLVRCSDPNSSEVTDQVLSVTHDQRLTLWGRRELGPSELSDRLPPGKLLWNETEKESPSSPESPWRVVVGIREQAKLSLVIASQGQTTLYPLALSSKPVREVREHLGILYVIQQDELSLFSSTNGQTLASIKIPDDMRWMSGRFFHDQFSHYAATFNGHTVGFVPIRKRQQPYDSVKFIFDCEGLGSPVAIQHDNSMMRIDDSKQLVFKTTYAARDVATVEETRIGDRQTSEFGLEVGRISPNGDRLSLLYSSGNSIQHGWLIDMAKLTAVQKWGSASRIVNDVPNFSPPQKQLRNRFTAIGVHDEHLVLITQRGRIVGLYLSPDSQLMQLTETSVLRQDVSSLVDFQAMRSPLGVGYELKVASWSDGSKAYLDSRGLLHLQSSTPQIPEMTFVLYDGDAAGWCDRNVCWGGSTFTGVQREQQLHVQTLFREWLVPFVRRVK